MVRYSCTTWIHYIKNCVKKESWQSTNMKLHAVVWVAAFCDNPSQYKQKFWSSELRKNNERKHSKHTTTRHKSAALVYPSGFWLLHLNNSTWITWGLQCLCPWRPGARLEVRAPLMLGFTIFSLFLTMDIQTLSMVLAGHLPIPLSNLSKIFKTMHRSWLTWLIFSRWRSEIFCRISFLSLFQTHILWPDATLTALLYLKCSICGRGVYLPPGL